MDEALQKDLDELNNKLKEIAQKQEIVIPEKKKFSLVNADQLQRWFELSNISNIKNFLVNTGDMSLLQSILTLEKRIICRNLILQRIKELNEIEGGIDNAQPESMPAIEG